MINRYASLKQGLVGCWCPSVSGSFGFRLPDLSQYGNHGTLTNMDPGTDWVPSGGKLALDFDGSNDWVTAPDTGFPTGNVTVSLSHWVNLRATSPAGGVFGYGRTSGSLGAIKTYVNLRGSGVLSVEYGGGNPAAGPTLTTNSWNHICVLKSPGPINTTTQIYLNGVLQSIVGSPSTSTPNIALSQVSFGVFDLFLLTDFSPVVLDDCRIYNRALTPSEIRLLYTGGRGVGLMPERIKHRRKTIAAATNRRRRLICGANC